MSLENLKGWSLRLPRAFTCFHKKRGWKGGGEIDDDNDITEYTHNLLQADRAFGTDFCHDYFSFVVLL